ncbi:MAG: MFS transporter [Ignavibacterium sp.]
MNQNNTISLPEPPTFYRWTVLIFVSLAMFGNYYIYDCISPLADLLVKQLHFSDSNIGLLQAIYSIPNVFMVLIGGIIIDRIGTRLSTLIFSVLCLIGAILTAVGNGLTIMVIGRLIFGLGAESLIVAVTTVIGRWFKGKELSFAFGLNLTIARLGSFAALNSPSWGKAFYDYWQTPLFISVIAGFVSFLGAFIYFSLEGTASKKFALKNYESDKINFKEIFSFHKSYWFIVLLCITFYSAIFPFQTFAVKFFMDAHQTTREFGGFLSSILTLSAMILTPLFGLFADYFGRRALLMSFGSFLIIPVYLLMAYTSINLFIPMIIMGIAFSLIPAVMWPSVAIIVNESKLGTAYGLMTMIQNIGLAGFNLLIGWANDISHASASNPAGYNLGMWIFSSLGFFGLVFAFLLRRSELSENGHGLERGSLKS